MENRYEEYEHFAGGLPFSFQPRITRVAAYGSREANWHENVELQLGLAGEGSVLLDGQRYPLSKGDTVIVNSGVIHHTGTTGELTYSCLILDTAFCRESGIDPTALSFTPHIQAPEIAALFAEITRCMAEGDDPCRTARLRILALSLLILLRERCTTSEQPRRTAGAAQETVKAAIRYIRSHTDAPLSLSSLAAALYVNKYVLSRHFKQVTRQTVGQYISHCRCRRAEELLRAGATVSEAAAQCGFANLSFFAKTFRRCIGVPPSACRP